MKKQIFKLTSILLAMVMVFTMFTMIPISAESETANLSTAVQNLKTAWENLDYAGFVATQPLGYYNGAGGNFGGQADYLVDDDTAPEFSSANYCLPFTADTQATVIYTAETSSSANATRMNDYTISQVSDWVFYYKTEAGVDATYSVDVQPYHNNGAGDGVAYYGWSGLTLNSTNGEWVRVSIKDWVNASGIGYTYEELVSERSAYPYVSRVTLVITASATGNISFSELGFVVSGYDAYLEGTESLTDVQWYDKAAAVDPATLKAAYNDAEESDTWQAFLTAREAVLACSGEVAEPRLREAAEEMITSVKSYAYPIQQGRTDYSSLMTATNSTVSEFGSYYRELTLPNYGKAIDASIGANSIWLQTQYVGANDNLRFGDMGTNPYITVEIISTGTASVAHLGFFGRFNGISPTDLTSSYTKEVVAGNTYQIYLDDILTGFGSQLDNWETTTKSTGSISGGLFVMGATDADVTLKVGSVVSETNYEITSTKTGTEFVAEMAALDISSFGNTAPFLAALEAALDAFPEAEELVVVENLRAAAGKMITSLNPVLYPAGYFNGSRNNFTTVTNYATSDAEYLTYGPDLSPEYTLTAQTARSLQGIWMTGASKNMNANTIYLDNANEDAYFIVKVVSVAGAGATIRITARLHTPSQNDTTGYLVTIPNVVAGKEYKVTLKEILNGMTYSFDDFVTTANGGTGYWIDFMAVEASGANATVQVGTMISPAYYAPSDKSGEEFVAEMAVLDTSLFSNTEEFETALAAALAVYPEIEAEIELANTVRDLKNTWKNLTYIPQQMNTAPLRAYATGGSNATKSVFADGDDASKGYLTSADGVGTAYLFPVDDYKDSNDASTPYEWFVWGNVGSNIFLKEDMVSFGFWYKSESQITGIRVIVQASTYLTTNGGVLPATGGEWSFITLEELAGATVWNNFLNNGNLTDISDFSLMFANSTARSTEIYFGDMVVYGKDEQIEGIDTWSNEELAINADKANLDVYEDDAVLKAQFATLTAKLKEIYAANFAAQDVIDAANKLGGIGLKPSTLIERAQIDEGGVWAGDGASYSANTNYLSNNGDQYVTINTEDFGNPSCSPDSGAVQYEAVTEGGIKLADIDDISFSYKIANKVGDTTVARIWFYNENYSRYLRTENEEGEEEFVLDDEGNKIIDRNNWQTGMEAYGTTRYFAVDADTDDEWVTTSIATIFGSDWKTHYLGYLNGSDIKTEDFTADNTYITKLALGFNGYNIEGDYADVTLGSMYVDYADDRFAIDADVADPAAVLAEALTIDASGCKKADADAFKKAVKALADALEENISAANCVAGNKAVTLVDLSLLARYVDAADKDAFVAANYIDLTAADINGDDVINEADVTALRLAMLTPAED